MRKEQLKQKIPVIGKERGEHLTLSLCHTRFTLHRDNAIISSTAVMTEAKERNFTFRFYLLILLLYFSLDLVVSTVDIN